MHYLEHWNDREEVEDASRQSELNEHIKRHEENEVVLEVIDEQSLAQLVRCLEYEGRLRRLCWLGL